MRKDGKWIRRSFTLVMLAFSMGLAAYTLGQAWLDSQIRDLTLSLDASLGRERKQQYEFDQAAEDLPKTRAELEETAPRAEAAREETARLKAERKRLREEKKELEARRETEKSEPEADSRGEETP